LLFWTFLAAVLLATIWWPSEQECYDTFVEGRGWVQECFDAPLDR